MQPSFSFLEKIGGIFTKKGEKSFEKSKFLYKNARVDALCKHFASCPGTAVACTVCSTGNWLSGLAISSTDDMFVLFRSGAT